MRRIDKIRQILNIVFLLGALATLVIYLVHGKCPAFMYVGFTSLSIKFIDFILRFIN